MSELTQIGELIKELYAPVFIREAMSEAARETGLAMLYGPLYGPAKPKVLMNPKRWGNPGLGLHHCDCDY